MNELPTGPLTFAEFQTLANLVRRFEVHHAEQAAVSAVEAYRDRSAIVAADQVVRRVYDHLYVPGA